jgi:hypothetical protein
MCSRRDLHLSHGVAFCCRRVLLHRGWCLVMSGHCSGTRRVCLTDVCSSRTTVVASGGTMPLMFLPGSARAQWVLLHSQSGFAVM